MKKYRYLFAFLILVTFISAGYFNYSRTLSGLGINNSSNETVSEAASNTVSWVPTLYETVNELDMVVMEIKKDTVSPQGLTISFQNDSEKQIVYGKSFWLEKKIDGRWYQVPVSIEGEYGFEDIGYGLSSKMGGEWMVDWEWLYGSLENGDYRIVKDVLDFRAPGDFDTHHLAAEFHID
jgi:hypothetical protein